MAIVAVEGAACASSCTAVSPRRRQGDARMSDVRLLLPFDLEEMLRRWRTVQRAMTRTRPDAFTRDEWAYLIAFVDERLLRAPFEELFGERASARIACPRGPIAVWLPNNVSLLGPLTLILLSLTGNSIRVKAGSRADDLASAFVTYARGVADVLSEVTVEQFDRTDPRNA